MAENYDDSMYQLAQDIVALEPNDLVLAGIYADKRGYHNKRKNLRSTDYSVQLAADKKGPSDKAAALDITSKSAQRGDYTIIKKYSNRLYQAGKIKDPRVAGWREFFGQTDDDSGVEGWDFAKGKESTSADKSHNWHIHMSELREFITSKDNKTAILSVLQGETLEQYTKGGGKLVGKAPAKPAALDVDGRLGPKSIARWQQIMGTPVDGVISNPSVLVKAVQRHLNKRGSWLVVDGRGIRQDGRRYQTVRTLQRYLGVPADGILSTPVSPTVKALQKRLNTGKF